MATLFEHLVSQGHIAPPPPPVPTPAQELARLDNEAISKGYCYRTAILPKRYKDWQLPTIYSYGWTITEAIASAVESFYDRAYAANPNRTMFEFETATYCVSPRLAARYDRAYQSEPEWDYDDPLVEEIILNYQDDIAQYELTYNTPYWDDRPFSQ